MAHRYTRENLEIVVSAKNLKGLSKKNKKALYEAVKEWLPKFEKEGIIKKKSLSKQAQFVELANPNEDGISRSVCVIEFEGEYLRLRFGNGGDWVRLDEPIKIINDKGEIIKYEVCTMKENGIFRCSKSRVDRTDEEDEKIEIMRTEMMAECEESFKATGKRRNAILLIRLCGLTDRFRPPISSRIRAFFKRKPCVSCGSKHAVEPDHKNGLYNDPRVLDVKTQKISDFQPLCRHCNLQKRQIIKEMKRTGKRYGATGIPSLRVFGIDFISGDETYDPEDINWGVGTYWHDPIAFNEGLKKILFK